MLAISEVITLLVYLLLLLFILLQNIFPMGIGSFQPFMVSFLPFQSSIILVRAITQLVNFDFVKKKKLVNFDTSYPYFVYKISNDYIFILIIFSTAIYSLLK